MSRFEIPGRLPGMNEITLLNRRHWAAWADTKRRSDDLIGRSIIAWSVPVYSGSVRLRIMWIEKDLRRDIDNISGGIKFILDALVKTGRIKDDSRKYVKSIRHIFPEPDKHAPRVIVEIY